MTYPERRLGELLEVKGGKRLPAGAALAETRTAHPYLRIVDFKDGTIDPSNLLYVPETVFPQIKNYTIDAGDIYISIVGTVGLVGRVPASLHRANLTENAAKLFSFSDEVDPGYLFQFLRSDAGQSQIRSLTVGSTQPKLALFRIKDIRLGLPPLPEQRAIAATLGALDDKIALNRKMNATLEVMARALFRDWFVDFGPTRAKMAGAAPYLSPDLWSLFPDHLDAEGKPEGWEVSSIGEEVRVVGGSTPSTKESDLWDGGINWATPKDLSTLAAPVLLETSRTISAAGLAKISSGQLPLGSLLLSSRAPIGYLAIAEVPVAINQGFIGMICDKRVSNVFAWLWTQANMEAILAKANGSTFQEISKSNFRPLPVVVPFEPVLQAFDSIAKPLYERIAKNERESRTLAQTRDLLLPRLMSGEIQLQLEELAS